MPIDRLTVIRLALASHAWTERELSEETLSQLEERALQLAVDDASAQRLADAQTRLAEAEGKDLEYRDAVRDRLFPAASRLIERLADEEPSRRYPVAAAYRAAANAFASLRDQLHLEGRIGPWVASACVGMGLALAPAVALEVSRVFGVSVWPGSTLSLYVVLGLMACLIVVGAAYEGRSITQRNREYERLWSDFLETTRDHEDARVAELLQEDPDYPPIRRERERAAEGAIAEVSLSLLEPALTELRPPAAPVGPTPAPTPPLPRRERSLTKIFVSYARADQTPPNDWLTSLVRHCKPYQDTQRFVLWYDKHLNIGAEWRREIGRNLASSDAAILLVGPAFLASRFVQDEELPPLLEAATNRGLPIFPLIVSTCAFNVGPLARFQAFDPASPPLDLLLPANANQQMFRFVDHVARVVAAPSTARAQR